MLIQRIVKTLAEKYNKDSRVVNVIVRHPFKFLWDVMRDPLDFRPVRFMYLGVFAQKSKRNKLTYIHSNLCKQSQVILGNLGL